MAIRLNPTCCGAQYSVALGKNYLPLEGKEIQGFVKYSRDCSQKSCRSSSVMAAREKMILWSYGLYQNRWLISSPAQPERSSNLLRTAGASSQNSGSRHPAV